MGIIWIFTTLASTKTTRSTYAPHLPARNAVENFLGWVYQIVTGRLE